LNNGSICIHYNNYIWIHFTSIIIKMQCKRRVQIHIYKASVQCAHDGPQRAHGALEDSTALPKRPYSGLSNTLCKRQAVAFVFSILKKQRRRMAFKSIAQQLHSVPQRCWRLHVFKRCRNAVRTPLWCNRGLNNYYIFSTFTVFCAIPRATEYIYNFSY